MCLEFFVLCINLNQKTSPTSKLWNNLPNKGIIKQKHAMLVSAVILFNWDGFQGAKSITFNLPMGTRLHGHTPSGVTGK